MYETEADTISQMTGTDYGNYSDFMRKAYHHEPVSMNRVSDKIHIDIESPRLSICITCTPGQLPSLFPTFENGLGSRFQFYELPDEKVEFHDVFAQTDNPLEDTYKQMGEELLPLYHAMQQRVGHPIQFVLSKAQQKKFLDTYGEVLVDQFHIEHPEIYDLDIMRIPNEVVADLFAESDYFVMPYQDIAQSGAITVAFRYNLPVLCSDIEQFSEFVTDGVTGFTFKSQDEQALADKMEWILNNHQQIYNSVKANEQKFVDENLSLASIVNKYKAFFDAL